LILSGAFNPGLKIGVWRRRTYQSFPLSRWRERVGVRVESKYIPLTFILSPWGEEMRRYALLNFKLCTFQL
jgi:hypothetical protein